MYVILVMYVKLVLVRLNPTYYDYNKGWASLQEQEGRKMAGISRYEKMVLAMTAAFLLATGGWFFARQSTGTSYEVVTQRSSEELPLSSHSEQPEENKNPDSLTEGEIIDLNTADVYDLQRLPGIGEKRAQAIVEYREEHGVFRCVEDITQVSGIGAGILAGLKEYATVG